MPNLRSGLCLAYDGSYFAMLLRCCLFAFPYSEFHPLI